MKTTILLNNA